MFEPLLKLLRCLSGLMLCLGFLAAAPVLAGEDELGDAVADATAEAEAEAAARRRLSLYFKGQDLFQDRCSMCHGRFGKGDGPWAEKLTEHRPRNFRTGVFKFRTTPMGFLPTDDDLRRTIRSGISGTAMPMFEGHLRDSELDAVIAYIQTLSRTWKDPDRVAKPATLPEAPGWFTRSSERRAHVAAGRVLFSTFCVACHGDEGRGDGIAAPELKDIWGHAIRPADLNASNFKSGKRDVDLYRTLACGLDGTPMAGFRPALSEAQIWDLVGFIRDLQRTEAERVRAAATP